MNIKSQNSAKLKFYQLKQDNKLKVVFIDDDLTICRLIEKYLNNKYDVTVFTDSKRGYNYVCQENPDILILDLHMPDMSGMEILKNLKENPSTCYIPIIILTGDDSDFMKEETINSYAETYIIKPVTQERIEGALSVIIKNIQTPPRIF